MTYKTPGVYVEEISTFPPSVTEVETAIPAFIGYTKQAKRDKDDDLNLVPTRIQNMLEYEQYFGGPAAEKGIEVVYTATVTVDSVTNKIKEITSATAKADWVDAKKPKHILYYAMQLFFANGGGPCYIVSVGKYTDNVEIEIGDVTTPKGILGGLSKLEKVDEPTLIVCPEAIYLKAQIYTFQKDAIAQCAKLKDRFLICDILEKKDDGSNKNLGEIQNDFRVGIGINDLKYAAAYFPFLKSNIPVVYDPADVKIKHVYLPVPQDPPSEPTLKDFKDKNNAGGNLAEAAIKDLLMTLPPSPAIAGVYAYVDATRGVWKAPANVSLNRVVDLTENLSTEEQRDFNVHDTGKSINVIRPFTGKGILVWGARTLDGASNEWRYINVRRFFNMVEESVQKSTIWAVFEPNTKNTWVKVKGMIENYLLTKWIDGALAGAKPEDAFFVRIGLGITMTADNINNGIMNVEIGMAVSRPAEFIILKFSHKLQVS